MFLILLEIVYSYVECDWSQAQLVMSAVTLLCQVKTECTTSSPPKVQHAKSFNSKACESKLGVLCTE